MSHADMGEQAPWRGNDHVSTHLEAFRLHVETAAVITAIDGDARDAVQIVAKALHGLVYLLCQLACGGHDDAVDGILGIAAVIKHAQHRQQVGSGLARTGLCDTY